MPNLNKVIVMGNLTRDPELRQTPNNTDVCQIGMAINRNYTDGGGEKQQETTFVDAEAWGKTGEVINQYLHKGDPILVEGRLKFDQWQDQDGNRRSRLKVVIERFEFIGTGSRSEATVEPQSPAPADRQRPQERQSDRRAQTTASAR